MENRPAPEVVSAVRQAEVGRSALCTRLTIALAGGCVLAGCAMFDSSAPLPPPFEFRGEVVLHRGAGLTRKTTLTTLPGSDAEVSTTPWVRLRVDQLQRLPETELAPLVGSAELVTTEDSEVPIRHAVYLTRSARVGKGEPVRALDAATRAGEGGRWATLVEREVALPTVMSAELTLSARAEPPRNQDYPRTPETENPLINRIVVNVGRQADGSFVVVVGLADGRKRPAEVQSDDSRGFTLEENLTAPALEVVMLDVSPEAESGSFALTLPSPFAGMAEVIVVYVEIRPAPGEDAGDDERERHARAVLLALEEGAASEAAALERAAPLTELDGLKLARQRVFEDLRANPDRVGLVYITGTGRAFTALDMVLVASDEEIREFTMRALPDSGRISEDPLPMALVGWHLEGEALRYLAEKYGDASLSPELRSVLLRHVGEVGRFPGMLQDAVNACANREQLEQRLIAENRLFLEDSDPSARVRAYDWLRNHGGAPEGFDPLASRDDRREALEQERDRLREAARERARLAEAESSEEVPETDGAEQSSGVELNPEEGSRDE